MATVTGDKETIRTFASAVSTAHRDAKRMREISRKLDTSLARLEEATYGMFGISYTREESTR